jgi:hypothetical protein
MMGATEREVLEALRAHAVQSKSRGRWAEVNPWDAYPDLTANLSEEGSAAFFALWSLADVRGAIAESW